MSVERQLNSLQIPKGLKSLQLKHVELTAADGSMHNTNTYPADPPEVQYIGLRLQQQRTLSSSEQMNVARST